MTEEKLTPEEQRFPMIRGFTDTQKCSKCGEVLYKIHRRFTGTWWTHRTPSLNIECFDKSKTWEVTEIKESL